MEATVEVTVEPGAPGRATLNVFVQDSASKRAISPARVVCLTRALTIDPPSRMVSGDGGANLYFNGPAFTPPLPVSLLIDAPGFEPFCSADKPIAFGQGVVTVRVGLVPFV